MNTTTTALIVNNPNAIALLVNKDLRKNVTAMVQASTGLSKSMWKYAIAVHNIVDGELFKDDFKTQRAFAKAMDTNESTLSKFYSAVECVTNDLPAYGYTMENITYSNAYLLSTIEDLSAFMEVYKDTDFSKIGKNQLEKLISAYKRPKDEAIEVTGNDEEPASDEVEETEVKANKGDITANISKGILRFTYRKQMYAVPMKDLKEYIVIQEEE